MTCCDVISNTAPPLDFKCIFPFRDGRLNGCAKYQLNILKIEVDLHSHAIAAALLNDAYILSPT